MEYEEVLVVVSILRWMVWGQTPDWYQQEMERSVGTWVADNSAYVSEQETDDAYGITWEWGVGKKSLLGSLYGLKEIEGNQ